MSEVLIPPWIQPQAESTQLVDDSTSVFRAAYAPGVAQRVSYVEPRLQVKQSYKGLRGFERAAMLSALSALGGKAGNVRAAVGYALRGSFPTSELLLNNSFANGTTNWTVFGSSALTTSDRMLRVKRNVAGLNYGASQSPSVTQFAAYAGRTIVRQGLGPNAFSLLVDDSGANLDSASITGDGYGAVGCISGSGSMRFRVYETTATGGLANDFFDVGYTSLSRCGLCDNGLNRLIQSTAIDNAAWTKSNVTISANILGPDGLTAGDGVTETVANSLHEVNQTVTVSSSVAEYSFGVVIKPNGRTFCQIAMTETTGSTNASAYFNLSTGAVGTTATGANWSSFRSFSVNMGGGWWYVGITAQKTNAATSVQCRVLAATADGTNSYTGTTASVAFTLWNPTMIQGGVPGRANATTSAATLTGSQPANGLYLKGLPASTAGLLLAGDQVEVNGELKLVTSSLDSDAAGCGFLRIAPTMCRAPSDGDAAIVFQPIGRFMLAADASWVNDYGVYADVDLTLEAINE